MINVWINSLIYNVLAPRKAYQPLKRVQFWEKEEDKEAKYIGMLMLNSSKMKCDYKRYT